MGIAIDREPMGIQIVGVHPDTPAAYVGLRPGDSIYSIDGVKTETMSVRDFIERGVGPARTSVELRIWSNGRFRTEVIERAHIAPAY